MIWAPTIRAQPKKCDLRGSDPACSFNIYTYRQATADAAVAAHGRARPDGRELFYASHNWHPFFLHGTKQGSFFPSNIV